MFGFSSLHIPEFPWTALLFKRIFLSFYFVSQEGGWAETLASLVDGEARVMIGRASPSQ